MSRHEAYWLGYRHGHRIAHAGIHGGEQTLRLELKTATNHVHRAMALGELRGYRKATR